MLQGSWRWVTSRSGDTRLVAPLPQPVGSPAGDLDVPPASPVSPDSLASSSARVVIPIDPCSPHIPVRHPPVNKDTLKELDLDAIMRNPQLRHDFLFDSGLQFRAAASRRKRDQAETYWRAVAHELETGCTCVTFDIHGRPHSVVCVCKRLPTPPVDPVIACLPLRRRLTLRMPSRIKSLLKELLVVLLSIIRPQTAAGSHIQGANVSYQQRVKQHSEQVQKLRAVLDAELIEQEMKHGLYDPSSTFKVVGEVLKSHCAPMRDQAVDAMVQKAERCSPGGGGGKADAISAIRDCFEILELMKLDIANHQMQTLRPHIIHTSPEFELRMFREHEQGRPPLVTQQWLVSAHRRLEASHYELTYPSRSMPFKTLGKRTRIILSALRGLIDLVFNPPSPVPLSSPVITTTAPSHLAFPTIVPQLPNYPETLYLDHSRLIQLSKDSADLTTLYMFLMLYRQLVFSSAETPSPRREITLEETDMQNLKDEIYEVGPRHLGRCFLPVRPPSSSTIKPSQSEDKDMEEWASGIQSVVLQVTSRASDTRRRTLRSRGGPNGTPSPSAPEPQLLKLAESWSDKHLRMDSPLGSLMRDRVRNAVFKTLVETVLIRGNIVPLPPSPGTSTPETKTGTATGLEPLSEEIRLLSERLAKLAVLHLNVYQTVYEQDEFSSDW
ncbi:Tcp11-domain-containing protein [Auriscalpium vulgare]|uniref:Tcp11-domain-containing protein n=1 Tax=Auriscalpium vulgare TaxID=40419 RepID=A0ACB8RL82_9AGAM|nr:Tcp11-domain-containing protein [Auriscalpium vulgare]